MQHMHSLQRTTLTGRLRLSACRGGFGVRPLYGGSQQRPGLVQCSTGLDKQAPGRGRKQPWDEGSKAKLRSTWEQRNATLRLLRPQAEALLQQLASSDDLQQVAATHPAWKLARAAVACHKDWSSCTLEDKWDSDPDFRSCLLVKIQSYAVKEGDQSANSSVMLMLKPQAEALLQQLASSDDLELQQVAAKHPAWELANAAWVCHMDWGSCTLEGKWHSDPDFRSRMLAKLQSYSNKSAKAASLQLLKPQAEALLQQLASSDDPLLQQVAAKHSAWALANAAWACHKDWSSCTLEWKWGSDADFRSRVLAKLGSYKDEEERKAKISRANAGRIPWNAGRAHSPETKAKIRAATALAMQRPEVRAKLEALNVARKPRDQATKEKIKSALQSRVRLLVAALDSQGADLVQEMARASDPRAQALSKRGDAMTLLGPAVRQLWSVWDGSSLVDIWASNEKFRGRLLELLQEAAARRDAKAAHVTAKREARLAKGAGRRGWRIHPLLRQAMYPTPAQLSEEVRRWRAEAGQMPLEGAELEEEAKKLKLKLGMERTWAGSAVLAAIRESVAGALPVSSGSFTEAALQLLRSATFWGLVRHYFALCVAGAPGAELALADVAVTLEELAFVAAKVLQVQAKSLPAGPMLGGVKTGKKRCYMSVLEQYRTALESKELEKLPFQVIEDCEVAR